MAAASLQNGTSFDPLSPKAKGGLFMTKTEHYNLPQWEANDPVRREDFNEAFAALDSFAEKAYTSDHKPYVTGYYTGNGTESQTIELGFRPQFLIIASSSISTAASDSTMGYSAVIGGSGITQAKFKDTGFTVSQTTYYPKLNEARNYYYIAFR